MPKAIPFDRLKRTTLYEETTRQIKRAILGGDYQPGDSLPSERDLARAFGVGRPTIREALKILRDRGLLELDLATRKHIVKSPDLENCVAPIREQISWLIQVSEKTMGDFWAVIPHVVGITAHAAMDAMTDENLQALSGRFDEMEASGSDFFAFCKASYRFGLEMARVAGNPLITLLWKMFENVIQDEFPPILAVLEPEGPEKLLALHRQILEAMRSGSHDAVYRAVSDRIEYLKRAQGLKPTKVKRARKASAARDKEKG